MHCTHCSNPMASHHRDIGDRMGLFNDESFIPDLVWPYRDTPFPSRFGWNPPQTPTQIAKRRRTLSQLPMNRFDSLAYARLTSGFLSALSPASTRLPGGVTPPAFGGGVWLCRLNGNAPAGVASSLERRSRRISIDSSLFSNAVR